MDGSQFFFARDGRTNPLSELKASIDAFGRDDLSVGTLGQHPQCAFPERYRFLKQELQLKTADVDCPDFLEWKASLKADSLTLVFSAAFPNSPASMFGHTLLQLNQKNVLAKNSSEKHPLLNYGINSSAMMPLDENPMRYVVFGLLGGYDGYFSIAPYYLKVNEYNNSESRDLWEYELNLTSSQIEHMINHLWELYATSTFDYYFLDDNCSYQILSLLEVANPAWDLTRRFNVYVLPADTIKAIQDYPGAITRVDFRPSLQKRLIAQVESLNPSERADYKGVIAGEKSPQEVPGNTTLDALITFYEYRQYNKSKGLPETEKKTLREILIQRSKVENPKEPTPFEYSKNSRPDLGHHSTSAGLQFGFRNDRGKKIELKSRFGLHDLLNHDLGYEPYTQVESTGGSIDFLLEEKKIKLNSLTLIEITSLYPFNFVDPKPSWTIGSKLDNFKDLQCSYCYGLILEGGAGLSSEIIKEKALVYFLAIAHAEAGKEIPKIVRTGPGVNLAAILSPLNHYKLILSAKTYYDLVGSLKKRMFGRFEVNQSFALNRSFDLRWVSTFIPSFFRVTHTPFYELGLNLNYYF